MAGRQASNGLWVVLAAAAATPLLYALAPDAAYAPALLQARQGDVLCDGGT